jgi:hypothetical protein
MIYCCWGAKEVPQSDSFDIQVGRKGREKLFTQAKTTAHPQPAPCQTPGLGNLVPPILFLPALVTPFLVALGFILLCQ